MVAVEVANMLHFWDEVNALPAPYIFIYMKNIQFTSQDHVIWGECAL